MSDRVHSESEDAKKLAIEDNNNRILLISGFIFFLAIFGFLVLIRDVAHRAGYRNACTDIAQSNRMSDDCDIAMFRGTCSIVCAEDEITMADEFEQLDQYQGDDSEAEKFNQNPGNTWFWCWFHGGCINASVNIKPVDDFQATMTECPNHYREDGSLIIECPATATTEAHQLIVPAR